MLRRTRSNRAAGKDSRTHFQFGAAVDFRTFAFDSIASNAAKKGGELK